MKLHILQYSIQCIALVRRFKLKAMIFTSVFTLGCSEFLDIDPPATQLIRQTVFDSDVTATAAMSGIYRQMTTGIAGGNLGSITYLSALASDETIWYSGSGPDAAQIADNNVLPSNPLTNTFWSESYSLIYQANAILEGIASSTKLSPAVRQSLEGEARFVRAFYHFYLANLFGDIPQVATTDYRVNAEAPRMTIAEIYQFAIDDLTQAYGLLKEDYTNSNGERIKPMKWAAAALLARVHLFAGNWEQAKSYASEVISKTTLYELADLDSVFLKNNTEAIFQLLPAVGTNYTNEGNIFLRTPFYTSIRPELMDLFGAGDLRVSHWINSVTDGTGTYFYPVKYKESSENATAAEYSMVLRLAEQYLIRAEANAHLNNMNAAIEDVDVIRGRAGLSLLVATMPGISQAELLDEILLQRRLELFTEWGHRWFDLKRTTAVDEVISAIKPTWEVTDQLFPVPEKEILANPNLLPQNPGY